MKLYPHQKDAVKRLKNGSILVGGTGTGKSITAIAYYFTRVCGGELEPYMPMSDPRPLYIITTAKKRDDREWDKDLAPFLLSSTDANLYLKNAPVIVDSWNNIKNILTFRERSLYLMNSVLLALVLGSRRFIR